MTDTSNRILAYIETNKQARVHDLVNLLNISQVAVHKQLNKLLAEGKIQRVGKPPRVFYVPVATKMVSISGRAAILSASTATYINTYYLYISPQGNMLSGMDGFQAWVRAIKEDARIVPLSEEYVKLRRQAEAHRSPQGWIDATEKMRSTFPNSDIKKLFYADFYSIPKFGKTKLGQLVLYAKQSQNKELIDRIIIKIKPLVERIVKFYNIDTLAFIPPSVPRRLQFMQEFNDRLSLGFPLIRLTKAYGGNVIVAQKTLSRLEERIENARDTIFVDINHSPPMAKNVLLIDDAVGSGATLEETAKKLIQTQLVRGEIIGFAIVGSIKGFEVIREV